MASDRRHPSINPGAALNHQSRAARFVHILESSHVAEAVANLETRLAVGRCGRLQAPISINGPRSKPTCYVCCPSAAYIDYARAELRHFSNNPVIRGFLDGLMYLIAPLMRATGLDHQVQINNWLLATNPLPPFDLEDLQDVTREVSGQWPGHAVTWRSVNDVSDSAAIAHFKQAGYVLLAARQIYLFDCRTGPPRRARDERRDQALLADGAVAIVTPEAFTPQDFAAAEILYRQLYLEKYTWLNPQYTAKFLADMHAHGLLEFHGLRLPDQRLCGVIAFFDQGSVMTAPIVGYDTGLPQELGLYRRLMAVAMKRARNQSLLYNMSAGAAGFKRSRGAIPAIEYTAVFDQELSWRRRLAVRVLGALLNRIGVPLLRSFEL